MDNLEGVSHIFWIVVAMMAGPTLAGVITLVLRLISRSSESPSRSGLRGIFGPPATSPRFLFPLPTLPSLNFANPWAWVYLVVVALLTVEPFFIAAVLMNHLLANLTN